MASLQTDTIDTRGHYDLAATSYLFTMGKGDPCCQVDGDRQLRWALRTPAGPVFLRVRHQPPELLVEWTGAAADWLQPHLPRLLGVDFQPPEIASPPQLRTLAKRLRGLRLPVLPAISHRVVQIILQQLISFRDASYGWRQLVRRHGEPVSGQHDLWFPPPPPVLAKLASHQFIECGILPRHARTIVGVMRRATRLESCWGAGRSDDSLERACTLLRQISGIGPWTEGFLRGAGLGDWDAVLPGDYGLPKLVSYFFNGDRDGDDAQMLQTLEPYRPHRYYIVALLIQGADHPPRRGPRGRSLRERFRS